MVAGTRRVPLVAYGTRRVPTTFRTSGLPAKTLDRDRCAIVRWRAKRAWIGFRLAGSGKCRVNCCQQGTS